MMQINYSTFVRFTKNLNINHILFMIKTPKISVIVPVYKAEKYLHRCINSILAQTFTDFEVLLIDDGSPDLSGEICDEFAQKDKRVRVFHKENGGANKARETGVLYATGEWINFVDSDDTLPIDSLYNLFGPLQNNRECDIVVGFIHKKHYKKKDVSIEEYRSCCISGKVFTTGPVAKLFRRSLFSEYTFRFPQEIINGEDMIMNIRLSFSTSKRVSIVNKKVYNYIYNPSSCTHLFQNSVAYEDFFYKFMKESIPLELRNSFSIETIERRLYSLRGIIFHNREENWKESDFYSELMHDIETIKYNVPFFTKQLLKAKSRFSIFCYYAIIKFFCS